MKEMTKIMILLIIAVSGNLAAKAKRGVPQKPDYAEEDFESPIKNLGGSEEKVVEESMKSVLNKNEKEKLKHLNKIKEHEHKMQNYKSFKQRSRDLLKRLKRAKNRKEYDQMLSGYKELVKKFKQKFQGCLPPPPPAPLQKKRAPTESRCHQGFRSGWKHGKQWAILITADNSPYEEGLKRVNCLTKWLQTKKESIYSICAKRGALQGYKKWYRLRTHRDELEAYVTQKRLEQSAIFENQEYYQKVMQKVEN